MLGIISDTSMWQQQLALMLGQQKCCHDNMDSQNGFSEQFPCLGFATEGVNSF